MTGREHERIIFALDVPDPAQAGDWVARLRARVGLFKVGLELYSAAGPEAVRRVVDAGGGAVFCDLKLHDIPATVGRAVRALRRLGGVRMLTVHVAGGRSMLEAAVESAGDEIAILGVTRLTSLAASADQVVALAKEAHAAGCAGVVASGAEVAAIRTSLGPGALLVCPGVRPRGTDPGDQARVVTPGEAVRAGADYVVIGRPLRDAPDPIAAARAIADEIATATR